LRAKALPAVQTQATAVDLDLPGAKCSALVFERHDILISFVLCERVIFESVEEEKSHRTSKKALTIEMKIDNLEKFAKTSLVAEVILDRLKLSRKEIERAI
jgi:hypothetical protein